MKYMLLIHSAEDAWTEDEWRFCAQESTAFCHELAAKGQFVAASPLHPVATATSVRVRAGKRLVTDGPFAETNELVAGFWIWQVKSMDEALAWAQRCPPPMPGEVSELELRPIFAAEDFGAEFTPELREQEAAQRAQILGCPSQGSWTARPSLWRG